MPPEGGPKGRFAFVEYPDQPPNPSRQPNRLRIDLLTDHAPRAVLETVNPNIVPMSASSAAFLVSWSEYGTLARVGGNFPSLFERHDPYHDDKSGHCSQSWSERSVPLQLRQETPAGLRVKCTVHLQSIKRA
jgi:hypothetical protein